MRPAAALYTPGGTPPSMAKSARCLLLNFTFARLASQAQRGVITARARPTEDFFGRNANLASEVITVFSTFSSHAELEQALLACDRCPLRADAIGPTSYNGTVDAPLAVVGEGPGGVEDEYGVPLVGPSGQLLDKALGSVGVTRDRIYVTNIIKCRPKGNRTPTVEEGRVCALNWLDEELAFVNPQVIVALGGVALKYLLGPEARHRHLPPCLPPPPHRPRPGKSQMGSLPRPQSRRRKDPRIRAGIRTGIGG